MTIVLLEDDEGVARGLGRVANKAGHRFIHARALDEVKAALTAERVDVLFADLGLPGGESGLDALRWARANSPGTLRVLTSGAVAPRGGPDVDWNQFLGKPFGSQDFLAVLEQAGGMTPSA